MEGKKRKQQKKWKYHIGTIAPNVDLMFKIADLELGWYIEFAKQQYTTKTRSDMQQQGTKLDFTGQHIYVGLDVSKRSWLTSIYTERFEHKTFSQDPRADMLVDYLHRNFPGAQYHAVYEAGAHCSAAGGMPLHTHLSTLLRINEFHPHTSHICFGVVRIYLSIASLRTFCCPDALSSCSSRRMVCATLFVRSCASFFACSSTIAARLLFGSRIYTSVQSSTFAAFRIALIVTSPLVSRCSNCATADCSTFSLLASCTPVIPSAVRIVWIHPRSGVVADFSRFISRNLASNCSLAVFLLFACILISRWFLSINNISYIL